MFKKVLSTTVLGISALGVMAANAAAPGVYVSGQLGYANTHLGNKTNIAALTPKLPGTFTPISGSDTDLANNGLAGRIALGYQFNPNFALEAGYLHLGQRKVDGVVSYILHPVRPGSLELQQDAIDLLAKGIIPVSDKFNLYGKAGLAYVNTNMTYIVQTLPTPEKTDANKSANIDQYKLAPEVALGVSYDITPNVSVDTSWTHIQAVGKNRPGNIDFVAVGLAYNFG